MPGPAPGALRFEPLGRGAVEACAAVLDQVLSRERELAAVRHPLGFLCLPIVREPDWGVCLHVWTERFPSVRPTTTGKHAHSWDLESLVLYGALGNTVFDLAPDDAVGRYQIAEIVGMPGIDLITPTGRRFECLEVSRKLISSGEVYRLRPGVFHETFLGAETEVATLVLGRTRDLPDLVLCPVGLRAHAVTRHVCTGDETRAVAAMVRDRLTVGSEVSR